MFLYGLYITYSISQPGLRIFGSHALFNLSDGGICLSHSTLSRYLDYSFH